MNNLVLITSIICTPNNPLSYTSTRSVYTHEERFIQTKKTIESIKEKIPNCKILIVECSELNEEQNDYFKKNVDYFINLIDEPDKCKNIYSESKALGEGTMTIEAINYIIKNNILFDNFFKISGRYWLSDNFNYINFNNNDIVIHNLNNDKHNTCTALYKIHETNVIDFHNFLISITELMLQCICYEVLFAIFLNLPKNNKVIHMNNYGINGYVAVAFNDLLDV